MSQHSIKLPPNLFLRGFRHAAISVALRMSVFLLLFLIAIVVGAFKTRESSIELIVVFLAFLALALLVIPLAMIVFERLRVRFSVSDTIKCDEIGVHVGERPQSNRWVHQSFAWSDVRSIVLGEKNPIERVPIRYLFLPLRLTFSNPEDPYIMIVVNDRSNKILYREILIHPFLERLPELVETITSQPNIVLKIGDRVVDSSIWLEAFTEEFIDHNKAERWIYFRYWYASEVESWF